MCVPVHIVDVISGLTPWFLFDILCGSCVEPVQYLEQYLSLLVVVRDSSITYMDMYDACKYDEVYIHIYDL